MTPDMHLFPWAGALYRRRLRLHIWHDLSIYIRMLLLQVPECRLDCRSHLRTAGGLNDGMALDITYCLDCVYGTLHWIIGDSQHIRPHGEGIFRCADGLKLILYAQDWSKLLLHVCDCCQLGAGRISGSADSGSPAGLREDGHSCRGVERRLIQNSGNGIDGSRSAQNRYHSFLPLTWRHRRLCCR